MNRIILTCLTAAAALVACGGGGGGGAGPTPISGELPTSAVTVAGVSASVVTAAPVAPPSAAPVAGTPALEPSVPVAAPVAAPVSPPAATPVATPVAAVPVTPAAPPVVSTAPVTAPVPVPAPAAPAVGAVTAGNSCELPNFQSNVLLAVNAARAQARACGNLASPAVAALKWSPSLMVAAAGHSTDMAQRNYFSHTSPEGATTVQRAQQAGYTFVALGENIAAGQVGVESVMKAWLASPGHCLNVMGAGYSEVAVACVSAARQQYPTYWTMVLGKPP